MVVLPRWTAEETKAPQSVDVQDQPMSPETLPPEAASSSEQGHPIPISESLVSPNRTRSGRAIHRPVSSMITFVEGSMWYLSTIRGKC